MGPICSPRTPFEAKRPCCYATVVRAMMFCEYAATEFTQAHRTDARLAQLTTTRTAIPDLFSPFLQTDPFLTPPAAKRGSGRLPLCVARRRRGSGSSPALTPGATPSAPLARRTKRRTTAAPPPFFATPLNLAHAFEGAMRQGAFAGVDSPGPRTPAAAQDRCGLIFSGGSWSTAARYPTRSAAAAAAAEVPDEFLYSNGMRGSRATFTPVGAVSLFVRGAPACRHNLPSSRFLHCAFMSLSAALSPMIQRTESTHLSASQMSPFFLPAARRKPRAVHPPDPLSAPQRTFAPCSSTATSVPAAAARRAAPPPPQPPLRAARRGCCAAG